MDQQRNERVRSGLLVNRKILLALLAWAMFVVVLWSVRWRIVDTAGICVNSDIREVTSPNGRRKAMYYTRDCGATTSWSTNVSVVGASVNIPHGPGNVFRAEWDRNAPDLPRTYSSGPPAVVRWQNGDQLIITYDRRADAWYRRRTRGDVTVLYRTDLLFADTTEAGQQVN